MRSSRTTPPVERREARNIRGYRIVREALAQSSDHSYLALSSFESSFESDSEESPRAVHVETVDYDGIAQLFETPAVRPANKPKPEIELAEHSNFDAKDEREKSRFRDTHNKNKVASKLHRFEKDAMREEMAIEKMSPKPEGYSNSDEKANSSHRFFGNKALRNKHRDNAVRDAMDLDTFSLPKSGY